MNIRAVFGATIYDSLSFFGPLPSLLEESGWEVHFVSSPATKARSPIPGSVRHHSLPMVRRPSVRNDAKSFIRWLQLLLRLRPNLIAVGTPKASLLGLTAAWLLRVPKRVYILRGLRLETSKGISRKLLMLLERITAITATHILSVSPSLAQQYVDLGLCPRKKITVIGSGSSHGVNLSRFSRPSAVCSQKLAAKIGLAPNIPVLGFVGRFTVDKGVSALLKVRKRLLENEIDHEMLIIGPIEDSHKIFEELDSLARSVIHLPHVEDVEHFYPLMTILLLPTKREGFPNVVLEAAAAGVPTITRLVTGARDAVINNLTGIVVTPDDDDSFASSLQQLLLDPERIKSLGNRARIRVFREFNESDVTKGLLTYYEEVSRGTIPETARLNRFCK